MKLEQIVGGLIFGVACLGGGVYLGTPKTAHAPSNDVKPVVHVQSEPKTNSAKNDWKKYELSSYPEYNSMLPLMQDAADWHNVSLEHLATICLTESKGKGGQRYESAFQKKYIDSNPSYKNKSEQERKNLATSTGPMQIMYVTAKELGFEGSFEELADPEANVFYAAKYLAKKGVSKETPLNEVLAVYNTGSRKGTPHKGYIERAEKYNRLLGK